MAVVSATAATASVISVLYCIISHNIFLIGYFVYKISFGFSFFILFTLFTLYTLSTFFTIQNGQRQRYKLLNIREQKPPSTTCCRENNNLPPHSCPHYLLSFSACRMCYRCSLLPSHPGYLSLTIPQTEDNHML